MHVAHIAGVPRSIVDRADEVAAQFEKNHQIRQVTSIRYVLVLYDVSILYPIYIIFVDLKFFQWLVMRTLWKCSPLVY